MNPPKHDSMRGWFAYELYKQMEQDPTVWVVSVDLGYKFLDHIRDRFPDRFINTGAAEQAAMGIAVGLALEGKKPFIYSITTFLLYRPFETIKLYLQGEQIPVRLVGGGRDTDYHIDGPSHDASDVYKLFADVEGYNGAMYTGILGDIAMYTPSLKEEIPDLVEKMVQTEAPQFISLRR